MNDGSNIDTTDLLEAARRLSLPQRWALATSYGEKAQSDFPEPLRAFWTAVGMLLLDVGAELRAERDVMLRAAGAVVAAEERAELGVVFLDADGNHIDPAG